MMSKRLQSMITCGKGPKKVSMYQRSMFTSWSFQFNALGCVLWKCASELCISVGSVGG